MLVHVPKKCDEFLRVRQIYCPIEGCASFVLSVLAGARIWTSQEATANLLRGGRGVGSGGSSAKRFVTKKKQNVYPMTPLVQNLLSNIGFEPKMVENEGVITLHRKGRGNTMISQNYLEM